MTAQEQPPQVQGQGRKPGGPHARGAAARRSYPKPKARGSGREEPPHVQGAVAAGAQECLEELLHVHGQEGRLLSRFSRVRLFVTPWIVAHQEKEMATHSTVLAWRIPGIIQEALILIQGGNLFRWPVKAQRDDMSCPESHRNMEVICTTH